MKSSRYRYGLTGVQSGMLFNALSDSDRGIDIEQISIRIHHALDINSFNGAWNDLINHHSALRACFQWEGLDEPAQYSVDQTELPFTLIDWRGRSQCDADERLRDYEESDRLKGFSLDIAPLMRVSLIRLSEDDFYCLWTFHHILIDGRSFSSLLDELFQFYKARRLNKPIQLPQNTPFEDYLHWYGERDHLNDADFWRGKLKGVHHSLPLKFGAPVFLDRTGFAFHQNILEEQETLELRNLARESGVTLHTLLQAAWSLLLHHYTRENDIVFGSTRACRHNSIKGSEHIVGLMINTVPFRVRLDENISLRQLFQQIRKTHISIREHELTPLNAIKKYAGFKSETMFDSLLVYDHAPLSEQMQSLGEDWSNRRVNYRGQTNFPLALIAYGGERLRLRIEYDAGQYDVAFIQRMLVHLQTLISNFVDHSDSTASSVTYLPAPERNRLLNRTVPAMERPHLRDCLHTAFERQVELNQDRPALSEGSEQLSYAGLNRLANQLAHRLIENGVSPGDFVGLCLPRSTELIVGLLAILKSGAAYVPLDPNYPKDRIDYIVEDAKLSAVVSNLQILESIQFDNTSVLLAGELDPGSDYPNPGIAMDASSIAYIIYTSGSTGKPKGVKVRHSNVTRLFHSTNQWFEFDREDVWSLFHSTSFDFSVWEIWGALCYGGRLVIVPYWVSRSPEKFCRLVKDEAVTVLNQTPSAFRQFIEASDPFHYDSLRYVIFGGESLELNSLKPWINRYGDEHPRLINMYGITETTVHVTYRRITSDDLVTASTSPIGEPISDLSVLLLDNRLEPVPDGIVGEMYISGAGVTAGYLNREKLTQERFISNPFRDGDIMYKSGDLARRHHNGELEYLGRSDLQVKVRGFRIETGEIEATLEQHPAIRQSVVALHTDPQGDSRLIAYLKTGGKLLPSSGEFRDFLGRSLPDYMIPAIYIPIDRIPLTPNGKVDRKALPEPSIKAIHKNQYSPPVTERQKLLCQSWEEVLGVDRVGIDDDFFDLGGDSILTIKIVARLRDKGYRVSAREIFREKTIAGLESCLDPVTGVSSESEVVQGVIPLLPIQRWFFDQNFEQYHYWNQSFLFDLSKPLEPEILRTSIVHLSAQHDVLRARYYKIGAKWEQRIEDKNSGDLFKYLDFSDEAMPEAYDRVMSVCKELQASLDISQGPTFLVAYISMPSGPEKLFLCVHHLLIDGVSWGILLTDLESVYRRIAEGKPARLPSKSSSVKSWAECLHSYVRSNRCLENLAHWQNLKKAQAGSLEKVLPQTGLEKDASIARDKLDENLTELLLTRANLAYNTQINDLLLTALLVAVNKWAGRTQLHIDLEGHGREEISEHIDLSRTIGWFTSLFPVFLQAEAGLPLKEMIPSVKEQLRAIPNKGLDYLAAKYLHEDNDDLNIKPAEILFNYLGQFDNTLSGLEYFSFSAQDPGPWHGPLNRRTHPIEFLIRIQNRQLLIELISDQRALSGEDQQALLRCYTDALTSIIEHCHGIDKNSYTPSDFPLCHLHQKQIDVLSDGYDFDAVYPLSPMQSLFYSADFLDPASGLEQWQFEILGPLDANRYRDAWQTVVDKHDILRTSIVSISDDQPVQLVNRNAKLDWSELDLSDHDESEQKPILNKLFIEDRRNHIDLQQPSLLRLILIKLNDEKYHLLWTTHHLCIDGWSWPLVFAEVRTAYNDGSLMNPSKPAQYINYIEWLQRQDNTAAEDYWRSELATFQTPILFSKSQLDSDETITRHNHRLGGECSQQLSSLANEYSVTLNTLFQALWASVLSRAAGVEDVVFGISTAGRPVEISKVESIIGPFVNNIPKRILCAADESQASLGGWLQMIQEKSLSALPFEHVSPVDIQQCSDVPLSNRLFESLLVFQNYEMSQGVSTLGSNITVKGIELPQTTNYPLTLVIHPDDSIGMEVYSQPGYFSDHDISNIWGDIERAIEAFINCNDSLQKALNTEGQWEIHQRTVVVPGDNHEPDLTPTVPKSTQEILNGIWSKTFSLDSVDPNKSFFDLGGQSVQLVAMHSEIEKQIGRKFPIALFFKYPTINALVDHFDGREAAKSVKKGLQQKARLKRQHQRRKKLRAEK